MFGYGSFLLSAIRGCVVGVLSERFVGREGPRRKPILRISARDTKPGVIFPREVHGRLIPALDLNRNHDHLSSLPSLGRMVGSIKLGTSRIQKL